MRPVPLLSWLISGIPCLQFLLGLQYQSSSHVIAPRLQIFEGLINYANYFNLNISYENYSLFLSIIFCILKKCKLIIQGLIKSILPFRRMSICD